MTGSSSRAQRPVQVNDLVEEDNVFYVSLSTGLFAFSTHCGLQPVNSGVLGVSRLLPDFKGRELVEVRSDGDEVSLMLSGGYYLSWAGAIDGTRYPSQHTPSEVDELFLSDYAELPLLEVGPWL